MEQGKNELLMTIEQNYTGAHEINIENSVAFTANIRASLEAAVKLFWKEKIGYIPSWTRGNKEIFITGQAVRSPKFTVFFERWALKEMEYICDACGDSVHGENMSIDTANELISSLDKSLRSMEKNLGFLIIPAIKKEEIKAPIPNTNEEKQQPKQTMTYECCNAPTKTISKFNAIQLFKSKGVNILSKKCTFSTKNSSSYLYWANPKTDLLKDDWWLILNDDINHNIHVFKIPANTFNTETIRVRADKPNLIDLQILFDDELFTDTRSKIQFEKWHVKTLAY